MVLEYFTDPVLRAPTLGCMLMSMAASLVGVIVFVRKKSLLGESLSHAAYPGVTLAVMTSAVLFPDQLPLAVLIGAFCSALVGLWLIGILEKKFCIASDAALCLILATFFGVGLTIASRIQFTYPEEYKQIQVYLYGQAATMTDVHILIYGALALVVTGVVVLLFKELQVMAFDLAYAKSIGIRTRLIETLTYLLIVLAVVIGIRSVGVVLMSAMLIAPAVTARQYTNKLSAMLCLAGCFGIISGFLGNYLSVDGAAYLSSRYPEHYISLPTGPMIVLAASSLALFSLLFSPARGIFARAWRIYSFRHRCVEENLLKALWRFEERRVGALSIQEIGAYQSISRLYLIFILRSLISQGWIKRLADDRYRLTKDGLQRASHIVRLHRLWEVYLVDYLGVGVERVHRNAEEIEHILTPELEKELIDLLEDPKQDPHHQPIPPKDMLFT